MANGLLAAQLLQQDRDYFRFKYSYIYYYFVASYLKDHISRAPTREVVARLSSRLGHAEDADIMLFLAHLSRDPLIIEEITRAASRIYSAMAPATLTPAEIAFVKDIDNA